MVVKITQEKLEMPFIGRVVGSDSLVFMEDPALIPSTARVKRTPQTGTDFQATTLERPH